MFQNSTVTQKITLLDQKGSRAILGNTLVIPIANSMLYVRPLYVVSTANKLPEIRDILAVFNSNVGFSTSLSGALSQALGTSTGGGSQGGGGTSSATAAQDLAAAAQEYLNAQTALQNQNLALYQSDVKAMDLDIQKAQTALQKSKSSHS
jgi:uncharacterized membrane protein (UPF0182 family)